MILTNDQNVMHCLLFQVACGSWHACAVDKSGRLYSWGYSGHGVLGVASQGVPASPTLVTGLEMEEIVSISCGHNFTLAWSRDGKAFSWGCGRYGVLGHGDERDCHEPKQIAKLSAEHVLSMDAGYAHCATVTIDKVYMFGKGKDLALGLGTAHKHNTTTPTEVPGLRGVKAVSCSKGEHHGHTLAVTHTGEVYSWGDGYKGKLGHGSSASLASPKRIPQSSFLGESIASVSSGGIHSAAVSDVGHVFTWGCGSDGRLGHPEAKGHRYLFKSDVPKLLEHLEDKATNISCSYYHCLALVTD
jgi:regulator of chromosome condensation